MNNTNIKPYGQFQLWVLNNFPFTIDDFDSITQYQMLLKCLGSIKEQIDVNSDLYKKIQDIENYLANLDLQDEVNHKIDEMVESGQLQEIITEYLQINGILGYDTVSDMVNATNIINGSICRTIGLNTYNDGKGAFYKIRTITNEDVVDGVNIIALNVSNTLIAELLPNYYLNQEITNRQNADINLQNQINNLNKERVVLIGDSYAYYRPDVQGIEGWQYPLQRILGLSDTDCIKLGFNGASFIGEPTFLQIIQGNSIPNHDTITKIVVCGGANEPSYTQTDLETAIETFIDYCKEEFPNAKVYIGFIGNYNTYAKLSDKYNLLTKAIPAYKNCIKYGALYLNNVEYIMNNYSEYYDNTHPNQNMCENLAKYIYEAIYTGSCNVCYPMSDLANLTNTPFSNKNNIPFAECLFNNKIILRSTFNNYASEYHDLTTPVNDVIVLGNTNFKYLRQEFGCQSLGTINVLLTMSDNASLLTTADLYFNTDNELYLFCDVRTKASGTTITRIRFMPTQIELEPKFY